MEDEQGKGYVLKQTGWITNSPILARILQGECSNMTGERPWHRHVQLSPGSGRAYLARVYPPKLVKAVLRGLKEQMEEDGVLSALEAKLSGPVPETPPMSDATDVYLGTDQFWDDVNGGWLDPVKVRSARREEVEWIKKRGVLLEGELV